jgi:hypothetical protein
VQGTPTAEISAMSAPVATPPAVDQNIQTASAMKVQQKTLNPWLVIWPGLGVLLGILALLLLWLNQSTFKRKNRRG